MIRTTNYDHDNVNAHSLRNCEAGHALTANDPPIAEKKLMRPLLINLKDQKRIKITKITMK